MCKNVGDLDSGIRVVIGVIVLLLGTFYQSWWGLLGLIPFLTGIFHYCPLYSLFKWNTTCSCGCCNEKPVTKKKKRK
ncbi:MAG: DUF2892 domain-containing protein [Candidatus Woesearchaeota archaeon]